jgi:hypothetical protein
MIAFTCNRTAAAGMITTRNFQRVVPGKAAQTGRQKVKVTYTRGGELAAPPLLFKELFDGRKLLSIFIE